MMAAAVPNAVTLVGTGNIARCDRTNDEATATILDTIAGTVFALGDGAYPNGTPTNYQNCYNASWGRHKARDRKSTRLNSSHTVISYAVFCLKKKKKHKQNTDTSHNSTTE